jgi:hypothetical protein
MDPVSAIGLVASVSQTLSAVGELVKYVNEVKNGPQDKARLAREAANLAVFLTGFRYDIERLDLGSPQYAGLAQVAAGNGPLDQLLAVVRHLSKKLKRKSRWKMLKALAWPLEKQEVDNMIALIERLKSLIGLSIAADNLLVPWPSKAKKLPSC